MNRKISSFAARVIKQSDEQHPADTVLRRELRADKTFTKQQAGEVAAAVFAYYRWQGWMNAKYPLAQQIVYATKLQEDFDSGDRPISDENLQKKSVPDWVKKEVDTSIPWLKSLQRTPTIWLRCPPGTRDRVAKALEDVKIPDQLDDALIYNGTKDLFTTELFRSGRFELQDINSQRVGLVASPKPGETWWDTCAGEGGKTVHLSQLMQNKGLIWATDRADWRLKKLKQRTKRSGVFNYRAAKWDGGERLPTKTRFDGILIDAPCSGLGTWARNPHARWTTSIEDVRELAKVQFDLLQHALPLLKPGGRLVYSVCTLTKTETTAVVKRFETAHPELKRLKAEGAEKGFLWPQKTGGNGMFIAHWQSPSSPS